MFALHTLGWNDFQQLCLTITREILGQTVESYLDSADGGRDGAFTGTWSLRDKETLSGAFVIQCKFSNRANYVLKVSDLSEEFAKAARLVGQGLCDSYVLMTNAGISGSIAERITALLRHAGVKYPLLLGSTWIEQQIRDNKRLRTLVPRVYGLGDLSQILDERAYSQSRAVLASMREDLARVVVTDVYQKAVTAINEHGFVLLIGEPAAGKTTIASLLAMAALDQWNASVLKLDNPGKVADHWNPDEPSQFFWLDDAFGVTQYEEFLVRRWNHLLPQIRAMLRSGARIVMTSRDYIYNRARRDLKESVFPLLRESQVVIDVHHLTIQEKKQILYNHLRLGRQPRAFRTAIKPFLDSVSQHPQFIPETARRLGEPLFTKALLLHQPLVDQFVQNREQFLQEVLNGLDPDSKAALALIYMRNGDLESPIELRGAELHALHRLGSDLGGCVAALDALNGSLAVLAQASDKNVWRFKHPTIGDAYALLLAGNPEYLSIYIQGTAPERLVRQVTCGEIGIQKAIVVPSSLFSQMLEKLSQSWYRRSERSNWQSRSEAERGLQIFLTYRCSREFLALFLERKPDLLERVAEPGLYLDAVSEVGLAKRLYELGLLPENYRARFVDVVCNYAISGEDASALVDEDLRALFTDGEVQKLEQRLRTELVPRLGEVRRQWEWDHQSGDLPDEHMERLLAMLDELKKRFSGAKLLEDVVDREIQIVNEWIAERRPETSHRPPRILDNSESQQRPQSKRSIFDDVDASDDEQTE